MSRRRRRPPPTNAHRAPGPTGVFVLEGEYPPRTWRWEGWPANDAGTPGRRRDLDPHYARLAARGRARGTER